MFSCAMKLLNVLSKFENHSAIETVRFQVQLEADGYFLRRKFSSLHSIVNRTSNPALSFYQSFPRFFLQAAESDVLSKLFVDTARISW